MLRPSERDVPSSIPLLSTWIKLILGNGLWFDGKPLNSTKFDSQFCYDTKSSVIDIIIIFTYNQLHPEPPRDKFIDLIMI